MTRLLRGVMSAVLLLPLVAVPSAHATADVQGKAKFTVTNTATNVAARSDRRPVAGGVYDRKVGRTFISWAGQYEDSYVQTYDHRKATWSAPNRIADGDSDAHNYPTMVQARDGHLLIFRGMHNVANALAACALVDVPLEGLRSFKGLPHRLELVGVRSGKEWYDDSKGTNVGATVAALRGLGKKVVLILGGEGKGQDFTPLREPVKAFAPHVLLIGRDAPLIAKAVGGERCASLEEAVQKAARLQAQAVLLSPACASFDMFRDYKHRGDVFAAAVRALPA